MDGVSEPVVFHETYGMVPEYLLRAFKRFNVSPADWDSMLIRWGFNWGDGTLPFGDILRHVETHSQNGYYQYPMYG